MASKPRKDPMKAALERAFKNLPPSAYSEHDLSAFAVSIGRSRQALTQWKRCPPHFVLPLEAASGVSRYELRPDIYGPDPAASGK